MWFIADALRLGPGLQVAEEITSRPQFHEPVPVFLTIMTVILVAPLISEYLRLPDIVGLVIGGVIVGPSGLHLLEVEETIQLFSTVGLIYLMFVAGLEIDIHQLGRVRNKALIFTALTLILPVGVGLVVNLLLFGMEFQGALLLGAIFATQTLVAFPVVQQLGITRDESVAVAVGATAIIDVIALLLVAALVGGHNETGAGQTSIVDILKLLVQMGIYTALILWGLPRIGRMFFSRFSGRNREFQFVIVVLFVAAYAAEFIGMEAIIGAFLAGLAVNTTLPHRSPVMGRVMFLGESFFIPIFLMYVGMITDPFAIFQDRETLLTGIVITGVTFATKFTAAWIAGRMFNYSTERTQMLFGLSLAHAAVALASVEIGITSGIFSEANSERIFSGVIMMVLLTCFASSLLVKRYGSQIRIEGEADAAPKPPLFGRILIPVANPQTEEILITLAGILTKQRGGTLLPLNIALEVDGHVTGLETQKQLMEARILHDPDTNIQPIRRVGTSISRSIRHVALETEASLIVMGWRGDVRRFEDTIFGTVLDEVVAESPIPVMVSRLNMPINAKQRVILVLPPNSILMSGVPMVLETAMMIATALNVPLFVLADEYFLEALKAIHRDMKNDQPVSFEALESDVVDQVTDLSTPNDLILVTSIGSPQLLFQSSLGRIAETLADTLPASLVVIHYPD